MTFVRDRRRPRRARELLVAAWGAVLLLLALSLPVLGAPPGPTKLLSPDVAPRVADTATSITFTITYRNAHALPPDYVRVATAGRTYPMSGVGTDWKAGVVFTVTTTLPAGIHDVMFEARDAERFIDELEAGTVSISQAPPAPSPTPDPTPDPTPSSGGTSGSGSTGGTSGGGSAGGSGTGSGSGGSDSPDGTGGTGDGPDGTIRSGSRTDSGGTGSTGGVGGTGSTGGTGGVGGTGGTGSTGSSGGSGGGTSGGSAATEDGRALPWFVAGSGPTAVGSGPGGSGDSGGGLAASGRGSDSGGPASWLQTSIDGGLVALGLSDGGRLSTIPAVVGSTLLVTTWMAFMLFNKRRRDGEPPASDDVLQAATSTGVGMGVVFAPAPPDPEALMPRWRRPSLLEARRTDPIRSPAPERPRLSFAIGSADAPAGGERRTIRYAVIPLLDRPDEILASRIGELVAGDEVQVEQRSGAYCHVLCPDGRQGWVHRTTLGDLVPEPHHGAGRLIEPEPEAENALAAMLAARGLR